MKDFCEVCDSQLNEEGTCSECEGSTNQNESSQFDKFMDKILITENRAIKVNEKEDSPQRKLAKLYREKAQNRIVYRRGGGTK